MKLGEDFVLLVVLVLEQTRKDQTLRKQRYNQLKTKSSSIYETTEVHLKQ